MKLSEEQINSIIAEYSEKSSGRYGDAFERVGKIYFNGKHGNWSKVAPKGHTDMIYHGFTFEWKSNCGQLDIKDLLRKDFIIYGDDNVNDIYNIERCAYVMTPEEFLNGLQECGLLRTKRYTNGYIGYAIQTYKNSLKKSIAWHAFIMSHDNAEEFKVLYKDTYKNR